MAETVGAVVKRLRERAGLTQGQLAEYAGLGQRGRSWLAKLEAGLIKKRPDRERLEQIARVLHEPTENLLAAAGYRINPLPPAPPTLADLARELARRLEEEGDVRPIILRAADGVRASAGAGSYSEESIAYLPQHGERNHEFTAIRVTGDCMEDEIHAGEIVVVDKSAEPTPGAIVVAERDGEIFIKWLRRRDGLLFLEANRAGFAPIPVTADVRIIGVVRWSGRPH